MKLTEQDKDLIERHTLAITKEVTDLVIARFEQCQLTDIVAQLTARFIGEGILDALDGNEDQYQGEPGLVARSVAQAVLMRMDEKHRRFMQKSISEFESNYTESMRQFNGT